jgi:hypothetical protein
MTSRRDELALVFVGFDNALYMVLRPSTPAETVGLAQVQWHRAGDSSHCQSRKTL